MKKTIAKRQGLRLGMETIRRLGLREIRGGVITDGESTVCGPGGGGGGAGTSGCDTFTAPIKTIHATCPGGPDSAVC